MKGFQWRVACYACAGNTPISGAPGQFCFVLSRPPTFGFSAFSPNRPPGRGSLYRLGAAMCWAPTQSSPESCIMETGLIFKPAALRKLCAEDDSRTLQLLRSMRKPFGRKLSLKSPKASFAAPVSKTLLASTAPELTYTLSQTSSNPIQPKLAQL